MGLWIKMLTAGLVLLAICAAAGADETWYVDTDDAGASPDGTLANPYHTLDACMDGKAGSITGRGVVTIYVTGAATDTAAVTLAGWTNTSASEYVQVICSDPWTGARNTDKYQLAASVNFGAVMTQIPAYTRVTGVQARNTSASATSVFFMNGAGIQMRDCLAYDTAGAGFFAQVAGVTLVNCAALSCKSGLTCATGKTGTLVNCVFLNSTQYGVNWPGAGTTTLTNCYVGGSTTADLYGAGTFSLVTSFTGDGSKTSDTVACSTATFAGVTAGSEDIHLAAGSDLIDVGTDVRGSIDPDTDIDGENRVMGSAVDVGPDEYTAVVGQALSPSPASAATGQERMIILSWTAGEGAVSHNVYFGTDSTPDETESIGNQAGTTYDPTGLLSYTTTYYWRIDEVNAAEGVTTGEVWSFATISTPETLYAGPAATGDGLGADVNNLKVFGSANWMTPGDTIYLVSGTYGAWNTAVSGQHADLITFKAVTDRGPVFDSIVADEDYLVLEGLRVDATTSPSYALCLDSVIHVDVNNCLIHGDPEDDYSPTQFGVYLNGVTDCNFTHNEVAHMYHLPDPGQTGGIKAVELGTAVDGLNFSDNYIHDFATTGLNITSITGDESIFAYNRISRAAMPAITSEHTGGSGIAVHSSGPFALRGNILYDVGASRALFFYHGGSGSPVIEGGYSNITVENNLIYETADRLVPVITGGTGYWYFPTLNTNVTVIDVNENVVFRNNTFMGGASAGGAGGVNVYHVPDGNYAGLEVYNNITTGSMQFNIDYYTYLTVTDTLEEAVAAADVNHIGQDRNILQSNFLAVGCNYMCTLAEATYWPTSSSRTGYASVDDTVGALFGDVASYPYRYTLAEGSIADSNSYTDSIPVNDIGGNPRDGTPDVGCYERHQDANLPPNGVYNYSPARGVTAVLTKPTLSWSAPLRAATYDVYLGSTWPPALVSSGQAGLSYTPGTALSGGTKYYWRVQSVSADGKRTWSDEYWFTTQGGTARAFRGREVFRHWSNGFRARWRR